MSRLMRRRGSPVHTLLIHGPAGAGHRDVATAVGQSVFCETGEGDFGACGVCRSCRRVGNGTHPDWITLEPDREGKGLPLIAIDTIRLLQDRMVLEPYEGEKVVGCILEAEKMRPETANSMLKLLEEPPPHSLFILVTENRPRILPTILSRCLHIPLLSPSADSLAQSLKDAGRSPDEALQIALWSTNEGSDPETAASDETREFREECRDLLSRAVNQGEYAFIPEIKARKFGRETTLQVMALWRDFLRDALLLSEGKNEPFTYLSDGNQLKAWATAISSNDLTDLIDHSFDYEEAIAGNANPAHSLITFLSEITERSTSRVG